MTHESVVMTFVGIGWLSDKSLANAEDLQLPIKTFKRDLPLFWLKGNRDLKKWPEEIEVFLDYLISKDIKSLDDLSEKEQNFLQTIRRFHWTWLRNGGVGNHVN